MTQLKQNIFLCVYFGNTQPILYLPRYNRLIPKQENSIYILSLGQGTHFNPLRPSIIWEKSDSKVENATIYFMIDEEIEIDDSNDNLIFNDPLTSEELSIEAANDRVSYAEFLNLNVQSGQRKNKINKIKLNKDNVDNSQDLNIILAGKIGRGRCSCSHHKSDLILISAGEEKTALCILLDGAASDSCVSIEALKKLADMGLVYYIEMKSIPPMMGLNNAKIYPGGIAYISIPLTNNHYVFPFFICQASDINHCIVLAGNYLSSFKISLTYLRKENLPIMHHPVIKSVNNNEYSNIAIYNSNQIKLLGQCLYDQSDSSYQISETETLMKCLLVPILI